MDSRSTALQRMRAIDCCEMSSRAALLQLAGLIGVEARYTDALGQTREVSDDTLLALTTAFGLPSDPVCARRQLEEQQRFLPLGLEAAHLVHAEDERPEVALRLPSDCRRVFWSCHLADGDERSGQVIVDASSSLKRFAIALPSGLPLGYHRLEVEAEGIEDQLLKAPRFLNLVFPKKPQPVRVPDAEDAEDEPRQTTPAKPAPSR